MNRYEEISQKAIAMNNDDAVAGRNAIAMPEKEITPERCEDLEKHVKSCLPLVDFWVSHALKRRVYAVYLLYVLPLLFTAEEMHAYFLTVLAAHHSAADTWELPEKKRDFKRIVGMSLHRNDQEDVENTSFGTPR